jgi:hypothetical protein
MHRHLNHEVCTQEESLAVGKKIRDEIERSLIAAGVHDAGDLDEVEFQELVSNIRLRSIRSHQETPADEMTEEELDLREASPLSREDTSRVLRAAMAFSGDFARAMKWYFEQAIPEFGDRTAAELVADGQADKVFKYIDKLSVGSTG